MATFVLVPGAWLGAWVWEPVTEALTSHGHIVHAMTLSGLDGIIPARDVRLATHVDDVLSLLNRQDLRDVVLIGHSYAGMVAGQVASFARARVRHTVFLDANVPEHGKSMTDSWSAAGREHIRALIEDNDGQWPAPEADDFAGHDLTDDQVKWLLHNATSHPGQPLFDAAVLGCPLSELSATYVLCAKPEGALTDHVHALAGGPNWRLADIDTGHWPMVSAPETLTAILEESATT